MRLMPAEANYSRRYLQLCRILGQLKVIQHALAVFESQLHPVKQNRLNLSVSKDKMIKAFKKENSMKHL